MNSGPRIQLKQKPSFEEFLRTCTPLYKNPSLEAEIAQRVESIAANLLDFKSESVGEQLLAEFLQRDSEFLGVVLAIANLSQEKFLRILTAERFLNQDFGSEWKPKRIYNKLKGNFAFALRIAKLFVEGKSNPLLASQIADFYLDQLFLPSNWQEIVRDKKVIGNIVRRKLLGEYTDRKGDYIEDLLRARLQTLNDEYGINFTKGQLALLGKEVDRVVPSFDEPCVLIMSSYMETTSSGQTARANEQQAMYTRLQEHHIRYGKKTAFVNVVDGAGWLAPVASRINDTEGVGAGRHG